MALTSTLASAYAYGGRDGRGDNLNINGTSNNNDRSDTRGGQRKG